MQFSEYQVEARRTDRISAGDHTEQERAQISLLGLAGEAGQLLSEFKNGALHRDGKAVFVEAVREELGDILWYASNLADQFGLSLDDIAFQNLVKTTNRWPGVGADSSHVLYDEGYPLSEQLPRKATLRFRDIHAGGSKRMEITFADGGNAGNLLTDNAYTDDGYRFHDAFHLAYLAVLGWSPVMRSLWKQKRKSNAKVDEVEDGGRATAIEEGIAALVFAEARERALFQDAQSVDSGILRIIKKMTGHLEVSTRAYRDWQEAILKGYVVFRALQAHGGGLVSYDMLSRELIFSEG